MGDQLIDLAIGALAVVAGDANLDVVGNDRPLQPLDRGQDILGHHHRVGPLLFADGDAHRLVFPVDDGSLTGSGRAEAQPGVAAGLGHAVAHLGHIPQIDRRPAGNPDHQPRHLFGAAQEGAAAHQDFSVILLKTPRRQLQVGPGQGPLNVKGGQTPGGEGLGLKIDPQLPRPAADDRGHRGVFHRLQPIDHLFRHPPQLVVGDLIRVKAEIDDGDVIDLHRLDHPARHPRRDQIGLGADFVVQLDQGTNAVFADVKTGGDHRQIGAGHGIDVLNPVHLPEQLLQPGGDLFLHLLGARSRHVHIDVGHGDDDLRLLLPGGQHQGGNAGDHREQDEDDR